MPQVTFSLSKREEPGRLLHAHTKAELSSAELAELLKTLREQGSPDMGDFATIYVAPEEYTLEVNEEKIPLKPQFFPPGYGHIINKLVAELK